MMNNFYLRYRKIIRIWKSLRLLFELLYLKKILTRVINRYLKSKFKPQKVSNMWTQLLIKYKSFIYILTNIF